MENSDESLERIIKLLESSPITTSVSAIIFLSIYTIIKNKTILSYIKSLFSSSKKVRRLTREDLLKHQIFKDIDFKLDYSINQKYDPDNSECRYDPGKIAIAREILIIQLTIIKEWLLDFIKTTDFDSEYVDVRTIFRHKYDKSLSAQYSEYRNSQIPRIVINKFLEVCKLHEMYLMNSIDDILSDKINLNIYEKVMIVLANFNVYINAAYTNMESVIDSINGDLKGTSFKRWIIGGNEYKCYPVPDKNYIALAKTQLRQLSLLTRASRCSVFVFHEYDKDNYLQGYFSELYEYFTEGLSSVLRKFQFLPASILGSEMITSLKQHKLYTIKVEDTQGMFKDLNTASNVSIICAYPIFFSGELRGFLEVCFSSEESFSASDFANIENYIKECCGLINIYVDYSKGLNYEGNTDKR